MRLTRRQLLTNAVAIMPVWPARWRYRRPLGGVVFDLGYPTSGEPEPRSSDAASALRRTVTMPAGEQRGDAYFLELVRAIGAGTSLRLCGVGPLAQLERLRVRGNGVTEPAGVALDRLLDAAGGSMSWELQRGAASGIYSLTLRRL